MLLASARLLVQTKSLRPEERTFEAQGKPELQQWSLQLAEMKRLEKKRPRKSAAATRGGDQTRTHAPDVLLGLVKGLAET